MKVSYVGHASILAQTHGLRILSDPWWKGPCFGAQWWHWPAPDLSAVASTPVDYVYVSHGHHDHLHPGTLKSLPGRPTLLVSRTLALSEGLQGSTGLPVREVGEDEIVELGNGVRLGIWTTHGGDSLMWLDDGERVLVNANDALHSAPASIQQRYVAKLKATFPSIDYFFCGYATASHFPNCYEVPGTDREASARKRQHYFNAQWLQLSKALSPRFAYPFAGDVAFFEEDLFWLNGALHNDADLEARIEAAFGAPDSQTRSARISPGFEIEGDQILVDRRRPRFEVSQVRRDFAAEIFRANRYGTISSSQLDELAVLLQARIDQFPRYFASCPFDYRYAFSFREGSGAIVVWKSGSRVQVQVESEPSGTLEVLTRLAYLRYALETRYGHEILFVGSGVRFRYRSREAIRTPVHREAMALLRPKREDRARPAPRMVDDLKAVARQALQKAGLRRGQPDLYALEEWLVPGD